MPATTLLKVTVNDQIEDGIILYKGHRYDIPYSNLISVSDVRNQQFNTSIDAQQYSQIIDNVFFVKGDLPAGLISYPIGFSKLEWRVVSGNDYRFNNDQIISEDEIFSFDSGFGTHLCGIPTTNGTYNVVFRVLGITASWDVTSPAIASDAYTYPILDGKLILGDAFFTLKIIVQDFPTSVPTTPTTPTQPVFEGATTGSSTSEVELHVAPTNTSTLTSSSRSITVPFTATRIATTAQPLQTFNIRFGGVEVMTSPFTTSTHLSTSCVFSVKISKTSSSMFKFEVTINSSFDGGVQQILTRSKFVSIASLSNSNLSFHATNAAGSNAPIISNVGNIDIV